MDGGSLWRRRADGRHWPRIRPAAIFASAGTLLTLLTIVLGSSDEISATQAIALALVALVTTLGGVIRMIVPDTWIAWRRGFQRGCEVATSEEASPLASKTAADTIPPGSADATVTNLVARSGERSSKRIRTADRS
jgi:hypothetical protein